MRGKEQGNSSCPIVEIRAEANELEHIGVAEPIEADPGGAAAAANRVLPQFASDLVGFSLEQCLIRRGRNISVAARSALTLLWRCRLHIEVFPNHLDLPINFGLIEHLQPHPSALKAGCCCSRRANPTEIRDRGAIAGGDEI